MLKNGMTTIKLDRMKRRYFQVVTCLVCLIACQQEISDEFRPFPGEDTQVKTDMEDGQGSSKRTEWIEYMHKAAPGTDWREIEKKNSLAIYQAKQQNLILKRDGIETIIEGELSGEWIERGSKNLAGSVFDAEYDQDFHELFLISAGGTLWKGGLAGFTWQVVNQDLRFTPGLLRMIRYSEDEKRLVACVNNEPFYSDDLGKTWTKSNTSYSANGGSFIRDGIKLNEGNQAIYLLVRKDWWANIQLLYSSDHGETYSSIFTFSTSDPRNLAMCNPNGTNDIYIIEQTGATTSTLHKITDGAGILETIQVSMPIGFGSDGKANLAATAINDTIRFLSYNGNSSLYKSEDLGKNWLYVGEMPIDPWDVRLFISKSNPDLLLTGGVEAFRSQDGGQNWELINGWGEYYGDIENKLHADMMHFNEFTDIFGDPFILISNHGGISKSYNGTLNNQNIGMVGLNVSQYYSVRTLPSNDSYVFGGSQDQGFQRGLLPSTSEGIFMQVISGDYGHIVFSDEGKSLWTVYPGGWVTFYKNPKTDYLAASWELVSENETVWIPPLMSREENPGNVIYMAGGSLDGAAGSYILRLETIQGPNGYEIVTDQIDFDFLQASGGTISAMAISPVNPNNWYVLTTNGKFYYSSDSGSSFQLSSSGPGSHYLYGSCILPSKLNPNLIYISGSGYSNAPVMVSYDGGLSFQDFDVGMPPTMAFALALNEKEDKLFVATEAGPFAMSLNQNIWFPMHGESAPNQTYWSVEYLPTSDVVRFGTYGRGIWDFRIENEVSGIAEFEDFEHIVLHPNPSSDWIALKTPAEKSLPAGKFTIMDINGNIIIRDKYQSDPIPIHSLAAGSYIISLEIENSVIIKKFFKY
jgi:hypothetical protein